MTVLFPLCPRGTVVTPRLMRRSGDLVSSLGGPTQRITRVGSRYAAQIRLPTLDAECAARWVACPLYAEALGETLSLTMPQTMDVSHLGAPTGTGVAGSAQVTYSGVAPAVGMWFSFQAGGRNYLHSITVIGDGLVMVAPLLRVNMPAGTPLEFVAPKLEGFCDDTSWEVEFFRFVGHEFTITESA